MISVKSNNSCSDVQRLYLQQLCINYVNVCSLMSKPVNTHKFYISKCCQVQLSNLSQHCFSFSTIYRAATLGQLENTEMRERKRKRERERERKQPKDLENVSQSHRHTLAIASFQKLEAGTAWERGYSRQTSRVHAQAPGLVTGTQSYDM